MAHAKGGLTNSKRFKKPEVPTIEDTTNNIGNVVGNVASTVANAATNAIASSASTAFNMATQSAKSTASKVIRSTFNSSPLVAGDVKAAINQADNLASSYGMQQLDLNGIIGGDPYAPAQGLPECSKAEANKLTNTIERQKNYQQVRLEKAKLGRQAIATSKEELLLVGDLVDLDRTKAEIATKVIDHQIAITKFHTQQSKLEQSEELLIQQQIATQGTLNLTAGIKREWDLKFEAQAAKNDRFALDVQLALEDIDKKTLELQASLLGR